MRYEFGRNWAEFLQKKLSDETIESARRHLAAMLRTGSLAGMTVIDVGCGSGIHSLAALRLGATRVVSFDYDADSVATTRRVREYAGSPSNWEVLQGSVLDNSFLDGLPRSDLVYSWGVLHHTGDMWRAVRSAATLLSEGGVYYISLYSSDNYVSPPPRYWMKVKQRYNRAGAARRKLMEWRYVLRHTFLPELRARRNPFAAIRNYGDRGMEFWTDVRDWLGGWPMDFASLAETREFAAEELGLTLCNLKTGQGCTEYVFADPTRNPHWRRITQSRASRPLQGPFESVNQHSYRCTLPHLEAVSDRPGQPQASSLMLYEDGVILGLAHSSHDHIAQYGRGRFSHWGADLYFSTSDGSDPNNNGRTYSYCEQF